MFLGVDGGGTKTAFALVDANGGVLARHEEGSTYHVDIGLPGVAATLQRGVQAVLAAAGVDGGAVRYAFFGLPAYGEDRAAQRALDLIAGAILGPERTLCGNDMVCSWAGSLACMDGISVIAGTGSMAYGEVAGRQARAGGWGELFSDEGSAHWIARAGLALFSRMSDGRAPRGPFYRLVRERLALEDDLDLCGVVYGQLGGDRSRIAQLARLVSEAAGQGDEQARAIFTDAARELADMVDAVRSRLEVDPGQALAVSYTGGLFGEGSLLLAPFERALAASSRPYRLAPPRLAPVLGAALYAARSAGQPLGQAALDRLASRH
ncbi:N-acetylglucosamine kinase [Massilia sp. HP4]|uniref:N-acetylglucosamine kinase n=1 Tax=Massilia sp. HP4 TaxID=2562316 RepID=UPI0010C08B2C|nr:BadF/BadG/BcrA/BcrD ATPase family protein [Massilia sp. HP4]